MISRIRIEAHGASATEVEATLKAAATIIYDAFDNTLEGVGPVDGPFVKPEPDGEMVIERNLEEPARSPYAFKGRMPCHLNVADDARQVDVLKGHGVQVSLMEPWREQTESFFATRNTGGDITSS